MNWLYCFHAEDVPPKQGFPIWIGLWGTIWANGQNLLENCKINILGENNSGTWRHELIFQIVEGGGGRGDFPVAPTRKNLFKTGSKMLYSSNNDYYYPNFDLVAAIAKLFRTSQRK